MTNQSLSTDISTAPSKGINVGLWVVQATLAILFGMAGLMKVTTPPADLVAQGMGWAGDVPAFLPVLIGVSELMGALGLVLPSALRIRPRLTVVAGGGLVVVMILAAMVHVSRGEGPMVVPNIVLGGLAAFVAWGRSRKAPIQER